ncbi:hypothetical protein GF345_01130 [Candidatus Woesearchaeota archaeon]|nr:hypothetical protein [Candidatus Woesearchaeota archaeon]
MAEKKAKNHNKQHKTKHSSKSHDTKQSKQSAGNSDKYKIWAALAILAALVLVIIFYNKIFPEQEQDNIVATVNGEVITQSELDMLYSRVPSEYKQMGMTPEQFLVDSVIPHKILLQEASSKGITATEKETDEMITSIIEMGSISEQEFQEQLDMQNLTMDDFRDMAGEQIVINKLINQSLNEMEIPDKDLKDFYVENKEMFATGNDTYQSYSEAKDDIRSYLANSRFMQEIQEKADVEILIGDDAMNPGTGNIVSQPGETSFTETSQEICTEDGKPLVILFSTTTCPHCTWIKSTFDSFAARHADDIAAYHWELDTNDNTLTPETESVVPEEHLAVFRSASQRGGVPTFVFGCKYQRIGNAYERSDDLAAEEQDFEKVLGLILS